MNGKEHPCHSATRLPNPNHSMTDRTLSWQHESHRIQSGIFPSLPASPSPLQSSIPATLHACLLAALPGEPTLRSATLLWLLPSLLPSLPTTHRAVTGLAASPLLHFSFHHFSLPIIFKVLARRSKIVHLVNHPSTAWARWWLAPVLTHVHAQKYWRRWLWDQRGLGSPSWLSLMWWESQRALS